MPHYHLIEDPDSLVPKLKNQGLVGVDTEFMRERTYFAQLCLIQISSPDAICCVDPLVEAGQAEFWKQLLADSWVVHSARQDIEVIYQTAGAMPRVDFRHTDCRGTPGTARTDGLCRPGQGII